MNIIKMTSKYGKTFNMKNKKRNPMAREVRTSKYKPRVVKPKKGKGSYKRKQEPDEGWSGIV